MARSEPPSASPPGEAPAVTVHKEMGIDHSEFHRGLPLAMGGSAYHIDGNRIVHDEGGKRFEIVVEPEQVRRLGLVRIPVTPVTLRFQGYTAEERGAAVARFERAYFRGGG